MPRPARTGLAFGTHAGLIVTKPAVDLRATKPSRRKGTLNKRVALVREVVREVAGFSPYEKRMLELLRVGDAQKDKRAQRFARRRLGTLRRAKAKRAELENVVAIQKKQAAMAKKEEQAKAAAEAE